MLTNITHNLRLGSKNPMEEKILTNTKDIKAYCDKIYSYTSYWNSIISCKFDYSEQGGEKYQYPAKTTIDLVHKTHPCGIKRQSE